MAAKFLFPDAAAKIAHVKPKWMCLALLGVKLDPENSAQSLSASL